MITLTVITQLERYFSELVLIMIQFHLMASN